MSQPIHDILQQLGMAISAQLEAANDRAASAETEYARLRDGLRALVGSETAPKQNIDAAVIPTPPSKPNADPVEKNVRGRTTIPNEPFFDALTFEWQSAHDHIDKQFLNRDRAATRGIAPSSSACSKGTTRPA